MVHGVGFVAYSLLVFVVVCCVLFVGFGVRWFASGVCGVLLGVC